MAQGRLFNLLYPAIIEFNLHYFFISIDFDNIDIVYINLVYVFISNYFALIEKLY